MWEFDQTYPSDEVFQPEASDEWQQERSEYLEFAQEDLQATLAIVQQSNELALKGRICEISPFLLILDSDLPLSALPKDIDFADLRTMDAVDLPKAVNSLCAKPISGWYLQHYGKLRLLRNQYTHLGKANVNLNPRKMLVEMIDQYLALWPTRAWLKDRVDFISLSRRGFFDDKNWSPRQEVMYELPYDLEIIKPVQFKKLFGVSKSQLKYICHSCCDDWAIQRNGPWPSESKTAFFDGPKKAVHCLMCDSDFDAVPKSCPLGACSSKLAAPDNAEFGAGACFMCGETGEEAE